MLTLNKDEREKYHEALAERNAAWAMVAAAVAWILYEAYQSVSAGAFSMDPLLILLLSAGVIAKTATNLYLRNK